MAQNIANSHGYKFTVYNWRNTTNQVARSEGTYCINNSGKQLSVTNVSNSTKIGTIYHTEHFIIVGDCYQASSGTTAAKGYVIIAFRNSSGAWDLGMINDEVAYLNSYCSGWNSTYNTVYTRNKSMTFGGVTYAPGTKLTGAGFSVPMTTSVGWRGTTSMRFTGIAGRSITGSFDTGIQNNSMTPLYFTV